MTRKFNFLCTLSLILLISTMAVAQPNATTASEDGIMQATEENAGKYPNRPKDMWEMGISLGHSGVSGDIANTFPAGFGVGVHFRKAFNYMLSYRGGYTFHSTSNTNHFATEAGTVRGDARAALISAGAADYVHASRTSIHDLSAEVVINLSNLNFHKSTSKWGVYAAPGLGAIVYSVNADIDNAGLATYNFAGNVRKDNLPDVQAQLGDYESNVVANDVKQYFSAALGVSYKISKQINLSLEHKTMFTNAEALDGSARFGTNNFVNDVVNFTNVRLNFNLGDPKKQVEPLYWLNPLDAPYDMIANNTQRLDNLGDLLADKDGDGVPDKLDKEQNTPAGAAVNTKGETLDSDGDGVPDYLDKEPFSEPGASVNGNGENTAVQPNYVTKEELSKMESDRDWVNKPVEVVAGNGGAANWFLPMIHFDNGSSSIKPTYYPQLDHVATVLKSNPDANIVVEGHASSTASVSTNNRLSYKRAKAAIDYLVSNYGISASRLTLRYKGESEPLAKGNGANYMNRRVEFRLNTDNETSMGSPE